MFAYNNLPKFAAKGAAGTNTHWALPNNVRICPLAKRYMPKKSSSEWKLKSI
ncbi:hypothetical protein TUM17387_12850 [Shewanella carassii]|nr:hypothetical protein TUM17387_12850 [Shewanella carassii]